MVEFLSLCQADAELASMSKIKKREFPKTSDEKTGKEISAYIRSSSESWFPTIGSFFKATRSLCADVTRVAISSVKFYKNEVHVKKLNSNFFDETYRNRLGPWATTNKSITKYWISNRVHCCQPSSEIIFSFLSISAYYSTRSKAGRYFQIIKINIPLDTILPPQSLT